jgi:hypothetical protein
MIMPEDNRVLTQLVRHHLSPQEASDCQVYYDTNIKRAGDPVRIGLREVAMPFRGFVVFVDLMPNANWGHRVAYFLASEDLTQCVRYNEQFPPFGADVPDQWRGLALTA